MTTLQTDWFDPVEVTLPLRTEPLSQVGAQGGIAGPDAPTWFDTHLMAGDRNFGPVPDFTQRSTGSTFGNSYTGAHRLDYIPIGEVVPVNDTVAFGRGFSGMIPYVASDPPILNGGLRELHSSLFFSGGASGLVGLFRSARLVHAYLQADDVPWVIGGAVVAFASIKLGTEFEDGQDAAHAAAFAEAPTEIASRLVDVTWESTVPGDGPQLTLIGGIQVAPLPSSFHDGSGVGGYGSLVVAASVGDRDVLDSFQMPDGELLDGEITSSDPVDFVTDITWQDGWGRPHRSDRYLNLRVQHPSLLDGATPDVLGVVDVYAQVSLKLALTFRTPRFRLQYRGMNAIPGQLDGTTVAFERARKVV